MRTEKKLLFWLLMAVAILALLFFRTAIKTKNITTRPDATPLVSAQATDIAIDPTDNIFGNPGAPITIVEFSDLGCSACLSMHAALYQLVAARPTELRLVWKDAPAQPWFGTGDELTHYGAYCAGVQNKNDFWKFLNMVISDKPGNDREKLARIATALNLNLTAWNACVDSDAAKNKIAAGLAAAGQAGVSKLPGIFINNKQINTRADIDIADLLQKIIEAQSQ